ncbi:MAG: HEPN domain-containing protein [Spirochaetaceae bacterium]|nr:HEPN domain-containing protein [Spirochaetaceae bacterium]
MSVGKDPVTALYEEYGDLMRSLEAAGDVSAMSFVDSHFRKVLLLASASYFERELTDAVREFTEDVSGDDHVIVHMVVRKVIKRQYHTWFNWTGSNANQFFSMFGATFLGDSKDAVRRSDTLSKSVSAFLEIGNERNRVVHEDFVAFRMEKTSEEIYGLYGQARGFVDWFRRVLEEYR